MASEGIGRCILSADVNQHWSRLLRYEKPELLGDEWTDADAAEDDETELAEPAAVPVTKSFSARGAAGTTCSPSLDPACRVDFDRETVTDATVANASARDLPDGRDRRAGLAQALLHRRAP